VSRVLIAVEIDDEKLEVYAQRLYDGAEHGDPVPPNAGGRLLNGWILEARHALGEGHLDTIWFTPDNDYVVSCEIERVP